MADEERGAGRDRIGVHRIRNCWALRREGLKGLWVDAEVAAGDSPALVLTGSRRGRAEIPLTDIRRIRASIDEGKFRWLDSFRCLIWCDDGRKFVLVPKSLGNVGYRDLILEIARGMKRVGRFDRVERGQQVWEAALYSVLMVAMALLIAYAAYDSLKTYGSARTGDIVFACITGGFSLLLLVGSVAIWGDKKRPRPVRGLKDLRGVLP
jgi:hypothetical protein